jgi:hypothetical protein
MPSRELPARPNLEQLKKQAKSLLDATKARDREARRRFAILPSLSGKSPDQIGGSALALHDAQSAIAREHGFPSWNALRDEVESRTLSFDAAVDEFVRCATGGATGRAARLPSPGTPGQLFRVGSIGPGNKHRPRNRRGQSRTRRVFHPATSARSSL